MKDGICTTVSGWMISGIVLSVMLALELCLIALYLVCIWKNSSKLATRRFKAK